MGTGYWVFKANDVNNEVARHEILRKPVARWRHKDGLLSLHECHSRLSYFAVARCSKTRRTRRYEFDWPVMADKRTFNAFEWLFVTYWPERRGDFLDNFTTTCRKTERAWMVYIEAIRVKVLEQFEQEEKARRGNGITPAQLES